MRPLTFSAAQKATDRLESRYIKKIKASYQAALADIKPHLDRIHLQYGIDGKLTIAEMHKMTVHETKRVTRLIKLERQINAELAALNRGAAQQLAGHLTEVYKTNYTMAGGLINRSIAGDISFDLFNRQAIYQSAIQPMGKIALEENAVSVRQNIKRAINQSIVQGESIQDMAERVQVALEKNMNRAVRIARTETTGIMGEARMDVLMEAKEKGVRMVKVWMAASDNRTRDDHADLDGKEVGLEEEFGFGLMFPGDQHAPVEQVVNCRCAMAARIIED